MLCCPILIKIRMCCKNFSETCHENPFSVSRVICRHAKGNRNGGSNKHILANFRYEHTQTPLDLTGLLYTCVGEVAASVGVIRLQNEHRSLSFSFAPSNVYLLIPFKIFVRYELPEDSKFNYVLRAVMSITFNMIMYISKISSVKTKIIIFQRKDPNLNKMFVYNNLTE